MNFEVTDGVQGAFQTCDPIPVTRFGFNLNVLVPSTANNRYLADAEELEHGLNTLIIPNILAAISIVVILVQYLYRQLVQFRRKNAVVTAVLDSPGGSSNGDESGAETYSWKDGEDGILAWNVARCVGCVLLFGISVWQVLHGE
jgi:hypothetical protein